MTRLLLIILCLSIPVTSFAINHENEDGTITTPNIIPDPSLDSGCPEWSGDNSFGSGQCYGGLNNTGEFHTGYQGGEITSDKGYFTNEMTIDEWQAGFTLDYGVSVKSHSSNVYVPLCSATNYDCKDSFTVELTLGDGNTIIETFTHDELLDFSGWRDYSYSQTIEPNEYEDLWTQMSLYGIDAGYTSGMYGPRFDDPFITASYSDQTPIEIQVLEQYLTQQLQDNFTIEDDQLFESIVTSVIDSEEMSEIEASGDYENIDISINIEDSMGEEIVSLEMTVDVDSEGTLFVSSTDSNGEIEITEIDIQEEIAEMEVEMAEMEAEMEMTTEPEPEVMASNESTEEEEPEEESTQDEEEQEEEDTQESAKASIKSKVVAAVVEQVITRVENAGGDVESTRMTLMNMLGGDMKFAQYQQASIPDAIMYDSPVPYISNTIDPLSSVYALGSDMLMNSMIDSQYK